MLAYGRREYGVRAERATLTVRLYRRLHPPHEIDLPPMPTAALTLSRGDRFRHRSAGGRGFRSPLVREPASVLDDVPAGKVGVGAAPELYEVVIVYEPGRVDEASAATLRGAA